MKVKNIKEIIESLIEPELKLENDPVGLLIGSLEKDVSKILISLDITPAIAKEAVLKKVDLIITHHPLFYKPISRIVEGEFYSDIIIDLIKNDISLLSYHTAYDMELNGVSWAFGEAFGLQNMRPLVSLKKLRGKDFIENYKLSVFTPKDHSENIKNALNLAGAGVQANYDYCFFQSSGVGNFRPLKNSNPFIGSEGHIESVDEVKVETIVSSWKLKKVINELIKAHPYEEVAYDIVPLLNYTDNYGLGVVGELTKDFTLEQFCDLLKSITGMKTIKIGRFERKTTIKTVALLGGSGAGFWKDAVNKKADIFLTSDISHHQFLEASLKINIAEITHHISEKFAIKKLSLYLKEKIKNLQIELSEMDNDPITEI
ncbi:MAG: Nif3-like dinuclear metal center hexameric protein [Candidatus Delongbacteria bacterium]|nr:Nif3-like dinuclear metal center hexameric protein [Candidatus Delongbacteria bacterium]MBN2835074.1 Nif3-like dinuclear metal center hexameric protein [Candidatus Delongbacteria bacterium]